MFKDTPEACSLRQFLKTQDSSDIDMDDNFPVKEEDPDCRPLIVLTTHGLSACLLLYCYLVHNAHVFVCVLKHIDKCGCICVCVAVILHLFVCIFVCVCVCVQTCMHAFYAWKCV